MRPDEKKRLLVYHSLSLKQLETIIITNS